jgi:EF hand
MKTNDTKYNVTFDELNLSSQRVTNNQCLPIRLVVASTVSFGLIATPLWAENTGNIDIQHYMKNQITENTVSKVHSLSTDKNPREKCNDNEKMTSIEQSNKSQKTDVTSGNVGQDKQPATLAKTTKVDNSNSSDQTYQMDNKKDPVSKPADGKGKLPTFAQADVNGDHYITKNELNNFPYLLQVFDKVDAGKDGKLEQHEYQSLKMETKREGEIS